MTTPASTWDLIEVLASEISDISLRQRLFERLKPLISSLPQTLERDDALTAAVAIRESTLNPAMGYSHRQHLTDIADRLEAMS